MLQKELATALGISSAMVSRLAKRGMPTDSIERATRWRKRHLEPGRVKGQRVDTIPPAIAKPSPAPQEVSRLDRFMTALQGQAASLANQHHARPLQESDLNEIRLTLRDMAIETKGDATPALPLCVWCALLEYVLDPDALEMLGTFAPNTSMTLSDVTNAIGSNAPDCIWLELGCDWHGYAVNGWPDTLMHTAH